MVEDNEYVATLHSIVNKSNQDNFCLFVNEAELNQEDMKQFICSEVTNGSRIL